MFAVKRQQRPEAGSEFPCGAQVRALSGLRTVSRPYHQRGVVATVRMSTPSGTAHQRFLGTGPLALLPVRGGFGNIVWSTTPPHAAALCASSPMQFAEEVNEVGEPM